MKEKQKILGKGWLPDYPDFRDYTVHTAVGLVEYFELLCFRKYIDASYLLL